ncbi:hypothetical protein EVC37_01335 [Methylocaldum sp. BRCS4]|nr:hypothetical protein [Methylocaldum sp. BRCS4]
MQYSTRQRDRKPSSRGRFPGLRYFFLGLLALLGAILFARPKHGGEPHDASSSPSPSPQVSGKLIHPSVPFIANQGQTDERVRFYAGIDGGTVYVTRIGEIVYDLPKVSGKTGTTGWSLKEALVGGAAALVDGAEKAPTEVNYLIGSEESAWRTNVPTYDRVTLGEVYEGIELELRASGATVEKLFHVRPGARPEKIGVRISGATFLRANDKGELEVGTGLGTVVFSRPKAYQTVAGRAHPVEVAYAVEGKSYRFEVGQYDRTKDLEIDPLIQATFLGGSGGDRVTAAAATASNVLVAGTTDSTDFPGTAGGARPALAGPSDGFVALLSSDLKTIIQATYLGGTGDDSVSGVAVSEAGIYVTGSTTSTDFPGTTGGARPQNAGGKDAFAALLTSNLKALTQATYFGGTDEDAASSVALFGGAYAVFVAGRTASHDLVGTLDSAQPLNGDPIIRPVGQNTNDGFIAAFSADLKSLTQATYLGGRSSDSINAIAVSAGFVYATGETVSTNFPKTGGGAQEIHYPDGQSDAFVALLTSDLTSLVQATYLGGLGQDIAHAIAVSGPDVFVGGETTASSFPGTLGGHTPTFGGATDGFVARLNSSLASVIQASFVGAGGFDRVLALGIGGSFFGPVVNVAGSFDTDPEGITGPDAFLWVLGYDLKDFAETPITNPAALRTSSFNSFGSSDVATALAVPPSISGFNVYLAGEIPPSNADQVGAAQPRYGGGASDGFADKLVLVSDYSFSPLPTINVTQGGQGLATVTVNSLNGFTGEAVKLGIFAQPTGGALPAGFTAPGFPQDIGSLPPNGSFSFTLTIGVASTVTPGTYTLWIVGFPGTSVAHAAPVTVNVVTTIPSTMQTISPLQERNSGRSAAWGAPTP